MTRADAKRAALLSRAWEDFDDWARAVQVAALNPASDLNLSTGYTQVVLDLMMMEAPDDPQSGGSEFDAGDAVSSIYVDPIVAHKLVPIVRDLLRAELETLGVEVDDGISEAPSRSDTNEGEPNG